MTTDGPRPTPPITELLKAWSYGDAEALEALVPMVQSELRRVARAHLRRERDGHTLQPTALVNEAYLRLLQQKNARWRNRAQFFAVAAHLMRRILVDYARRRRAAKRGGASLTVTLGAASGRVERPSTDVLVLHEALVELAELDPRQSQVVELLYFGGLTLEEAASVLDVSLSTVKREWRVAKLWLFRQITNS